MSVEKLLAAISAEADIKEKTILDEARAKAESLREQSREKTTMLDLSIERKKREIASRAGSLAQARDRMGKRSEKLQSLNSAVEAVLAETKAMFIEFMDSPEYAGFLAAELEKIKEEAGAGIEIHADPKTASVLEKLGAGKVIADKTVEYGFTAISADGRVSFTCALNQRLEKLWRMAGSKFTPGIAEALEKNGN